MPKFAIKFFPTLRLDASFRRSIQSLIERHPDAPIPETPDNSLIFLAMLNGHVIGFAFITIEQKSAKLTSLFIQPQYRRKLFGFKLMLDILDKLSKTGCQTIKLNCSEPQIPFFHALGFIITKERRTNQGSEFSLENPCPAFYLGTAKNILKENGISLKEFKSNYKPLLLSYDKTHHQYTEQHQFLSLHRSMLSQAQKQIWLISDTIQSPLLNDETVRDSLLRLSKRNPKAEIRILLEDDKKGAGHYNPTIDLAQKLTSFIEIRAIQKGAKKPNEMITAVDFSGGIFRKDLNNYAGFAHYSNNLIAERLRDKFDQHWQYAKPSLQLRRLSI